MVAQRQRSIVNILIVKLSAIGDVVHTLPSLAALRHLYPQAHITWVVEEAAADLIKGHPYLDRVLVSRRKYWQEDLKKGNLFENIKEIRLFVAVLRDRNYDLVIDFHGLFKSAVLAWLSGGARKLGFQSMQEGSGLFYTEKIPEDMGKHAVDRYLDFPAYLGAKSVKMEGVNAPEFLIPVNERNVQKVSALLTKSHLDIDEPFVAMNPVALWNTKLWRQDRFAMLADRIAGELNIPVVITGSAQEKPYAEAIIKRVNTAKVVDLAGRTTLKDLACLYRQAALVVTTDSGPMHIAAAAGTPVVALFGPTDPRRTGPYGRGHTVISKTLPCSPCFLKQCRTRECMEGITVEDVWEVVKEKLREETETA
ncbi:MAG TPA: lipopolysaccharide heptosyltransferase II [Syntrophus sp. (in: bacteria)]|nr:lipopolysaccharide heptosyltransferase II [Syntrophus sp. (in: bacteria)]